MHSLVLDIRSLSGYASPRGLVDTVISEFGGGWMKGCKVVKEEVEED